MVDDVRRLVTMDFKAAGHRLVLVGATKREFGGSHLVRELGRGGGVVPGLDPRALEIHRAVYRAIQGGLVESCHDLSEGGLAVAVAESAFAGGVGAEIRVADVPLAEDPAAGDSAAGGADAWTDVEVLFSESNSRYLLEVAPEAWPELERVLGDLPFAAIGETIDYHIVRAVGRSGDAVLAEALPDLESAWRHGLTF